MLGFDAEIPGLPCTVSVPNLKTDRPFRMSGSGVAYNVRRLMYQPLIWGVVGSDEAGGMLALPDAEDLKCLANSLVHGVGRNAEPDRNFLR